MNFFSTAGKTSLLLLAFGALHFSPRTNGQTQTGTSATTPETKAVNADNGWHVTFTPYVGSPVYMEHPELWGIMHK